MGKIWKWLDKWRFVIALVAVGITMLFALGCCIYTAIINPFVGIVGIFGLIVVLGVIVYLIWEKVSDGVPFGDY